jgi:ABC-type phosphate transport system substrate-binding protein
MTDLRTPGSRALLIGPSKYDSEELLNVPAVLDTMYGLRNALVSQCGMANEDITFLLDPREAHEVATVLAQEAQRTRGVLLVYYVGHGRPGPEAELYLAAERTRTMPPGQLDYSAISYDVILRRLKDNQAQAVVVILDCCFSGLALDRGVPKGREGGVVFTSAASDEHALAPAGQTYTTFTGQLLALLANGDPDGPAELTIQAAYDYLSRTLAASGLPVPQWAAAGAAGRIVLTANRARREETAPEPPPRAPAVSGRGTIETIALTKIEPGPPPAPGAPGGGTIETIALTKIEPGPPPAALVETFEVPSAPSPAGSAAPGPSGGPRRADGVGLFLRMNRVLVGAVGAVGAVVALAVAVYLAWPSRPYHQVQPPSPTPTPGHLAASHGIACASGPLLLVGATDFAPIAQAAADAYMQQCKKADPKITVNPNPAISYDSAYGYSYVRGLPPQQAKSAIAMYDGTYQQAGPAVLVSHPEGVLFFSIIANAKGFHASNITTGDLTKLFVQPDGKPGTVAVERQEGSGGRKALFTSVFNEPRQEGPDSRNCSTTPSGEPVPLPRCTVYSTQEMLTFVNGTPNAIGYANIYESLASYPNISVIKINGIPPTKRNARNGSYPFWSVEQLYTVAHPAALTQDFLTFLSAYLESHPPPNLIICSQAPKADNC